MSSLNLAQIKGYALRQDGLQVSMSASCGRSWVRAPAGSYPRPPKMVQTASLLGTHALGKGVLQCSPTVVWKCLYMGTRTIKTSWDPFQK